jgi:hypothetical protein
VVVQLDFLQRLILWRKIKTKVAILERGAEVYKSPFWWLTLCLFFEPNELVKFILVVKRITSFHQFCSGDTIEWFEQHGVKMRMTDMFSCFKFLSNYHRLFSTSYTKLGIKVLTGQSVQSILKKENVWKIETQKKLYY